MMPFWCAASKAFRICAAYSTAYSTAFSIGQASFDRRAFNVLHDELGGTDIVVRTNVGMIQRRHGASFALETLADVGAEVVT